MEFENRDKVYYVIKDMNDVFTLCKAENEQK